VSDLARWLESHTAEAPAALRARVREQALSTSPEDELPTRLARAGQATLERVAGHTGDRSVALDLLAADALITLALLAQAQRAPEGLEAFATTVLQAVRPTT
jgi:hypothetical protein